MNIVFMGTPGFAVPALTALAAGGYAVRLVVTQPDQRRDRGKKVQCPPVKAEAVRLGIEVLQPSALKGNEAFLAAIKAAAPDVIVVAAYGKLLPQELLVLPKLGVFNIHASLLPRWRGAAPIQRAILAGDEQTGVTIMRVAARLDAGDMLAARQTPIEAKTAGALGEELAAMGAGLLLETLPAISNGTFEAASQDEACATYAERIDKKEALLDFRENPEKLARLVRAFAPQPGAYTLYAGERMKVLEAEAQEAQNAWPDGTVTAVSEAGIAVAAGGQTLQITAIQLPGRKKMTIRDYLKGNKIEKFSVLG